MTISPNDRADIAATRRAFIGMMQKLTPKQQSDRAQVIASGIRRADPLTRALAQQLVDVEKVRSAITAKERELAQIEQEVAQGGHRPRDPDWKGRLLARKSDLERGIKIDHAHGLALMEDPLTSAEREAAELFREQRAAAAKTQRIQEAVARKTAEADEADIDALADSIVSARRFDLGTKNSGEAQ